MDDLITWLKAAMDDDERVARACAEVYPPPWDVSDRGHTAEVKADEPDFRRVAELQQDPAIDGWLSERLDHIARWDPARVLADIDSKRRIVAEYIKAVDRRKQHREDLAAAGALLALLVAVKAIALPYADRPGYREEWNADAGSARLSEPSAAQLPPAGGIGCTDASEGESGGSR